MQLESYNRGAGLHKGTPLAAALRRLGILVKGQRCKHRAENQGRRLVIFPSNCCWHSIILEQVLTSEERQQELQQAQDMLARGKPQDELQVAAQKILEEAEDSIPETFDPAGEPHAR